MEAETLLPDRDRILVTGGAGFVGSALVDGLLARGRRVRSLDVRPHQRLLPKSPDFEGVVGDVLDDALLEDCLEGVGLVLHLAAEVGVDRYVADPETVLDTNILGTRKVLRACTRRSVKVVFVSSSEVYGKNSEPLGESADSVFGAMSHNRWSYALSKAVGEQYAHALGRQGLSFAIVRIFNAYGPLIDDPDQPDSGRVISKFIGALRSGRPLSLVDGGRAVRAFVYIDDVVEAMTRLAFALEAGEPVAGRAYNVGRPEPVTIRELAERMIRLSGRPADLVEVEGKRFFGDGFEEIPHRVPDVSALQQTVGFSAGIDLEEGLRRTLRHWKLLSPEAPKQPADLPVLPMVRPNLPADGALMGQLRSALLSGRVTNDGPIVRRFEQQAASWLGAREVIATGSGSASLQLAFGALDRRGVVVLPSFTYIATLSAFAHFGLEPVFCDIDPRTFTMCPDYLQKLLAEQQAKGISIAAIMPVNVFGVPADLARIANIARGVGAALVYDNAHGFGTEVDGRRLPAQPLVQAFSLHATKVLPAIEGGLLVTDDSALASELRRLRAHGLANDDLHASTPGWNARMNELCAAVAERSLSELDENLARRRAYAQRLRRTLASLPGFSFQVVPEGVDSNFQNLGLVCEAFSEEALPELISAFRRQGVEARRYFHPLLHRLNHFRGRPELPITEQIAARVICLPLHSRMSELDLERVEQAAHRVSQAVG